MATNLTMAPLSQKAGYLRSRKIVQDRGMRLASTVLHEDYLVSTDKWKEVGHVYPAWGRELIVYPEKNGRFTRGRDVVDSKTGWRLPGSFLLNPKYVDADAFIKGIGLFVDPSAIEENGGRVNILPLSIVVLSDFIQENARYGSAHKDTGVPLALDSKKEGDRRVFFREDGVSIRPPVFDTHLFEGGYDIRRDFHCNYVPSCRFGIAGETDMMNRPAE